MQLQVSPVLSPFPLWTPLNQERWKQLVRSEDRRLGEESDCPNARDKNRAITQGINVELKTNVQILTQRSIWNKTNRYGILQTDRETDR